MQAMPEMSGPDGATSGGASPSGTSITCFTPGTRITTIRGRVPVETLVPGDRILTRDRGFQPLLWLGWRPRCATATGSQAADAPVRIRAGALGPGMPERDMIVSGHHHVLYFDPGLRADHGEPEALIEARALIGQPGIEMIRRDRLWYVHLLLEQHEVILSENAWTESFLLTSAARQALGEVPSIKTSDLPTHIPARLCLRTRALVTARP